MDDLAPRASVFFRSSAKVMHEIAQENSAAWSNFIVVCRKWVFARDPGRGLHSIRAKIRIVSGQRIDDIRAAALHLKK